MAKNEFKAKLTKIVDLTPTVRELHIKPSEPNQFQFKAGQFVMLNVPTAEKIVQRAYSVASSDHDKSEFKLVIKFYEVGVASTWVRGLKAGEELTYTGPFGKYLFREPPAGQVVFVCTSTGLAPFHSMLTSNCQTMQNIDFKVFMGVWNKSEIFYEKELLEIKKTLPRLEVNYVLDKPEPGWTGMTGYVTDHVAKLDITRPTEFYLCGNPAMLKSVKEKLLSQGMSLQKIYMESYG